ncbi:MAG TPA: hypothetical protein VNT57_02445 [Desulfobacteria bacterium]|nr:hypothetical protein [Desulfobacteria bacterium]
MRVDSPSFQSNLARRSLAAGLASSAVIYILGYPQVTLGLLFGLLLMLVNWRVLSEILRFTFRFTSLQRSKMAAFVFYHLRFWTLVLIMFVVIPKTNLYFGIGTFLGLLIPKIMMGPMVYMKRSEEWWTKKFPARNEPPSKPLSYLEQALLNRNPFEIDPIEIEINRYYQSLKRG